MPIDGVLRRGDRIRIDGAEYAVRPSGTATYLHTSLAERHARTVATYRLRRDGVRVDAAAAPAAAAAAAAAGSGTVVRTARRPGGGAPRRARVVEADIRYLYAARDMSLPASRRELKLGISSNLASTLRTYHRRLPHDAFVLIVECTGAARPLEQALLREFVAQRVDASEVLSIRMHELVAALRRRGYVRGRDSLFRKD